MSQDNQPNRQPHTEHALRLVRAGGLLEVAGLLETDEEALLGGLLELARVLDQDVERVERWKQEGAAVLGRQPQPREPASATGKEDDRPPPTRPYNKHSIPHG